MRVLVTGASGFVGRHVVPALVGAGYDVHAVSSRPRDAAAGVTWHQADLLQAGAASALVRDARPEGLVHLAWFTTPPAYWHSAENLRWVAASLDLFRAFVDSGGRRLVGVGTCAEYDWSAGTCVERVTPIAPETLYGAAKAAVASVMDAYARAARVSAAWARLFFIYGPDDHPSRLIPSIAGDLLAGREATCRSGALARDFLHVADAGAAISALFASDVTGPVNIASGTPVTLGAVAQRVAAQLGCSELLRVEPGEPTHPLVVASVARLRDEVRWTPRWDLDTGLRATLTARPAGAVT